MLKHLLFVLLVGLGFDAYAGYANVAPPQGWGGNSSSGWTFNRPAANSPWSGGSAVAQVTQQVEGRAVTMSASMRMAANAGRYVAAAARITPGGIVTSAVAAWLLTEGIVYIQGQWQTDANGAWTYPEQYWFGGASDVCRYPAASASLALCVWKSNLPANDLGACRVSNVTINSATVHCTNAANGVEYNAGVGRMSCPAGQVLLPTLACGVRPGTTYTPATDSDWAKFDIKPVPDQVANDTPAPLPVGLPNLNPDVTGLPKPVTVPMGDPVPVPETAPQQYKQPVADIVPSATQTEPWRVDVRPREVVGTDPAGVADPGTVSPAPAPAQDLITCGLPGKHKCLIDEQDTPTSTTANEAPAPTPQADVDGAIQPIKDIIADVPGKLGPFPDIVWNFQLPSACGRILLPEFAPYLTEIDICQFQPEFHNIMSTIWMLGGLFGAISLFWRDQLLTP